MSTKGSATRCMAQTSAAPFVPPPELAAMAAGIGATWANDKVSPVDLADPIKIMSQKRRQVLCCPPHV
jgi:hypothetical protein